MNKSQNSEQSSPYTRCTKIVATVGPASDSSEMIREFILAGVNVIRVNASHGDHDTHRQLIARVRKEARKLNRSVGILFDLQGPKIRIGRFEGLSLPKDGFPVKENEEFAIAVGRQPRKNELPTDYDKLDQDVSVGDPLLIADGVLSCIVTGVEKGKVTCRTLNAGVIEERKGINLPHSEISIPAITEKDKKDVVFAVSNEVDAIALSFVRKAEDVLELKELLAQHESSIPIVSKIEKPQALDNLEEILLASWGVMVARGDLGVELSPEEVPLAQKKIISLARTFGRPVITATQMLDSMTRNLRPTRAEVSDVANAVLDSSDAVMLSNETAVGEYPLESIKMMVRIITTTERGSLHQPTLRRRERHIDTIPEAIADAAVQAAYHLSAHAIVAFTRSGMSAAQTSRRRPTKPIIAFSPITTVKRRLSFYWGVQPFSCEASDNTDLVVQQVVDGLVKVELAAEGNLLVLIMGSPAERLGHTNLLLLHRVGENTGGKIT